MQPPFDQRWLDRTADALNDGPQARTQRHTHTQRHARVRAHATRCSATYRAAQTTEHHKGFAVVRTGTRIALIIAQAPVLHGWVWAVRLIGFGPTVRR